MSFTLYLITDRRLVVDLPRAIDRALAGVPRGAAAVQLREKDLPARALLELALRVGTVCRRHGAPFLIADRMDVARAAGADGVHLGGGSVEVEDARRLCAALPAEAETSGRGRDQASCRLIGASCHDHAQLAQRAGADFVLYSPIFATPGKGPAVGLEALRDAAATGARVFALGGVDASNAAACVAAGAAGVAAIRAWLGPGDPAEATAALHDSVLRGKADRISQGSSPPPMTGPRRLC